MSKKDFSVALKYVEARPRSQRRKGTEARVSGISVVGSGASATDLSLLQANLISVTNNFTALKDLFDSMFEKDSDGNIHAKLALWSSGGITAGGVGSGGSGGGGISYNRLDSWADYSADKSGWVLSALLGKDLDDRVNALANAGYITTSALAPYALRSEIPSLVGYATQGWVGENYLSKSGGKLVYSGAQGLEAERTDGAPTHIMFLGLVNGTSRQLGGFGMNGYNDPVYVNPNGIRHKVLTAENYSDYALSVYGGTVNSPSLASLVINRNNSTGASVITFTRNSDFTHFLGFNDNSGPKWLNADYQEYPLLHSGNYSSYALPITGGIMAKNSYIDWGNTDGFEDYVAYSNGFKILGYNAGSGDYRGGIHVGVRYGWQLTRDASSDVFQIRNYSPSSASWGDWKTIAFTSDIPTKLSQLTDDVVAGKYLLLRGGTLSGSNRDLLSLDTSNTSGPRITLYENGNLIALIGCVPKQTTTDYGAYFVNVSSRFGVILGNDKKAYITLNTDTMSKDYQILHSGNYSDYALSKYGGTVNGSITANSFIGNLTGNADSADFVAKTYANENINFARDESKIRLVSGVASNSTDLGFPKQYTAGLSVVSSYCGWQMVCYGSNIDYNPYYRSVTDKGVWGSWRQIAFLTDNVASATKLATPRTIWGQSFDGTGNITGDIMFAGSNKIAWHNDKKNYYISSTTTSTSAYLEYNAYGGHSFLGGNVAIGGGPAYERLYVYGNGKFTGALTSSAVTTNSLTIGSVTLTYDSANNALCVNGNMYALGGITAGGAGISAYTSLEARVARLEQQLNIS